MLARSKLNSIKLKQTIRMMISQRGNTEKVNLIEEDKKQALMRVLNTMKLLIKV